MHQAYPRQTQVGGSGHAPPAELASLHAMTGSLEIVSSDPAMRLGGPEPLPSAQTLVVRALAKPVLSAAPRPF